jgi:hypothetical protein
MKGCYSIHIFWVLLSTTNAPVVQFSLAKGWQISMKTLTNTSVHCYIAQMIECVYKPNNLPPDAPTVASITE